MLVNFISKIRILMLHTDIKVLNAPVNNSLHVFNHKLFGSQKIVEFLFDSTPTICKYSFLLSGGESKKTMLEGRNYEIIQNIKDRGSLFRMLNGYNIIRKEMVKIQCSSGKNSCLKRTYAIVQLYMQPLLLRSKS